MKKVFIFDEFGYQEFPEVEGMVEVDETLLARIGKDKMFNVENKCIVDYVKPVELVEKEKAEKYPYLVEKYIREKYTLSAELAILRQRDVKTAEFDEYNAYAEQCKIRAKNEIYGYVW